MSQKNRDIEHLYQCEVVSICRLSRTPAEKIYAIPNGGLRKKSEAIRLKAEGVLAGIPDLFLPHPVDPYHGLYIEMKAPDGKVSTLQHARIKELREAGYRVVICYSVASALDKLNEYLGTELKQVV